MKVPCQLANRESIRAFYADGVLLIAATGSVSAGDRVDIDMVRPATTPLEFLLERCPKPGVWPTVMQPYRYSESFVLTRDPDRVRIAGTIKVHHADGVDDVPLEAFSEELPTLARAVPRPGELPTATGYSSNLSFDEAFREAVKLLSQQNPPTHPDELLHVRVDEIGGLFGGFAGFSDLYVRITSTARRPGGNGGISEIAPHPPPVEEIAPHRPGPIQEMAPGQRRGAVGEVIIEVAPHPPPGEESSTYPRPGDIIVEVAPPTEARGGRPSEVITEVAPHPPPVEESAAFPRPRDIIVEVAPPTEARASRPAEVVTEVAPGGRPLPEIIVEVAPEVAPEERDTSEVMSEVMDERARRGPIVEVAPERPGSEAE